MSVLAQRAELDWLDRRLELLEQRAALRHAAAAKRRAPALGCVGRSKTAARATCPAAALSFCTPCAWRLSEAQRAMAATIGEEPPRPPPRPSATLSSSAPLDALSAFDDAIASVKAQRERERRDGEQRLHALHLTAEKRAVLHEQQRRLLEEREQRAKPLPNLGWTERPPHPSAAPHFERRTSSWLDGSEDADAAMQWALRRCQADVEAERVRQAALLAHSRERRARMEDALRRIRSECAGTQARDNDGGVASPEQSLERPPPTAISSTASVSPGLAGSFPDTVAPLLCLSPVDPPARRPFSADVDTSSPSPVRLDRSPVRLVAELQEQSRDEWRKGTDEVVEEREEHGSSNGGAEEQVEVRSVTAAETHGTIDHQRTDNSPHQLPQPQREPGPSRAIPEAATRTAEAATASVASKAADAPKVDRSRRRRHCLRAASATATDPLPSVLRCARRLVLGAEQVSHPTRSGRPPAFTLRGAPSTLCSPAARRRWCTSRTEQRKQTIVGPSPPTRLAVLSVARPRFGFLSMFRRGSEVTANADGGGDSRTQSRGSASQIGIGTVMATSAAATTPDGGDVVADSDDDDSDIDDGIPSPTARSPEPPSFSSALRQSAPRSSLRSGSLAHALPSSASMRSAHSPRASLTTSAAPALHPKQLRPRSSPAMTAVRAATHHPKRGCAQHAPSPHCTHQCTRLFLLECPSIRPSRVVHWRRSVGATCRTTMVTAINLRSLSQHEQTPR